MASLLGRSICTLVDKLSNNMLLACKYVMVHRDAQVNKIQSAIHEQDPTFVSILGSFQNVAVGVVHNFSESLIDRSDASLPFLHPIPKASVCISQLMVCNKFLFRHVALGVTGFIQKRHGWDAAIPIISCQFQLGGTLQGSILPDNQYYRNYGCRVETRSGVHK